MESGFIKFASDNLPPVKQGKYTLTVRQELSLSREKCEIKEVKLPLNFEAEPLYLLPDNVYSVYPPKDSYGRFDKVLPHVVLKRQTFPWERELIINKTRYPWVNLMLYDETEDVLLKTVSCKEAFSGIKSNVYCPVIYNDKMPENCMVLDVAASLFCETFPHGEDLNFMAHVRGVNRDNKVTEGSIVDEWLSVLVGNRYPASKETKNGVKNTAFITVCEYFTDFLENTKLRDEIASGTVYDYVRIPVLASWDFYSYKESFDFKTVFLQLSSDSLAIKENMTDNKQIENLFSMGYVPLNHNLRDGSNTVSWYRGPMLPYKKEAEEHTPRFFSDSRLIFDPEMAMFDISYSTAFNFGRQLGLQSGSFSTALDSWRRKNKRLFADFNQNKAIANKLISTLGETAVDDSLDDMVKSIVKNGIETALESEEVND